MAYERDFGPYEVDYEWAIEMVDANGDIQDIEHREKFSDLIPSGSYSIKPEIIEPFGLCKPRICHIRRKGNDDEGIVERGYAYIGDERYCSGQKVRKHIINQLNRAVDLIEDPSPNL